ncbi:MAG: lauroyl acyltransferase [Gammaproteobacteria bacterium]|nr:lauroyl acyltransferase [Gammaproteobacteria bacterium]
MAEFILGNSLSGAARKYPFIQRVLWRIDFALVWSLIKVFSLLPPDTASRFGSLLGRVVGPRLRRKTEMFRENLSIAFPEKSAAELEQLILQSWRSAGRVLAEYPHFNNIYESRDRQRLHIELLDPTLTFGEDCPPVVVVGAHHCNWEMVASAMGKLDIPNVSLYTPPTNPLLDQMLSESRKKLNCELIPRDNAARVLIRALKAGRSAGLVMDRRVDDGIPVPFFGRDKPSTLLPAKLALKFGIELIPARVERLRDAEFKVSFYPPVHPTDPNAGETEQAADMIRQVHALFEDWIQAEPQDWFCPKRMWPKNATDNADTSADDSEVKSYAA